jgi:hypothetical protein
MQWRCTTDKGGSKGIHCGGRDDGGEKSCDESHVAKSVVVSVENVAYRFTS